MVQILQMVQFECPMVRNLGSQNEIKEAQFHPYWELGEFPFPIISPLG